MRSLIEVEAGLVPYRIAEEWQRKLHRRIMAGEIDGVVLLLEHPHVYTLGRRFNPGHILVSREELGRRGVEVLETDRGGSITYHGPGQLVAYPVVDLRAAAAEFPDVIRYLRLLEGAVAETVREFGVRAGARPGLTGVWAGEAKLASIGVNVSRGVSKHGVAINVTTDLSFFEGMVPCGIEGCVMTSLGRLLPRPPSLSDVGTVLAHKLAAALDRRLTQASLGNLGLDETDLDETDLESAEVRIGA